MSTQIAEYSATEAGLSELRTRFHGMTWDLSTTKGDKEARGARLELVSLRTSLEAERKKIKAPALAYCKQIDAEADRITGEIKTLESPIDALIKADEKRRADEKAERDRIERERVSAIQERMAAIRSAPMEMVGKKSAEIREALDELSAMTVDGALFEEFELQAQGDRADAVKALTKMYEAVIAQEAEAARIKTEREELAQQQAEQRRIEAEAVAERRAQEEADRVRREAEEAAFRENMAAQMKAQQAEIHRQQAVARAEADELERKQEAFRQEQEAARLVVEAKAVEAEPKPVVDAEPKNDVHDHAGERLIMLGDINAMIAPLSIRSDGLEALGFPVVTKHNTAHLYRASDLAPILRALIKHLYGCTVPDQSQEAA